MDPEGTASLPECPEIQGFDSPPGSRAVSQEGHAISMSIKLLDRGWRFSKAKGGDLLVLLGIADFANDEGVAYPSIATLARKARLTPRNTQRAIRRLVAKGELMLEDGKGPHGVHLYRIVLPEGNKSEGCQNVRVTEHQGDIYDRKGVTFQPCKPSEETVIKRKTQVDGKMSSLDPDTETPSLTPEFIHALWNSITGVKRCKVLGPTIRDRIQRRLKEQPSTSWWMDLFEQISKSDFLCGRIAGKDGTFQASLDWVLVPKIFDKILAGNYDSIASSGHASPQTCSKRVQKGEFLMPCGAPIDPRGRPTEPRCIDHLAPALLEGSATW